MGSIIKRGTKWAFVIEVGRDEEGKRKQKWFSGYRKRKDAYDAMIEKEDEINKGKFVEPSKETLKTYMNKWFENKKTQIRPSTARTYDWLIHKHIIPNIGHLELAEIKPQHLQEFYTKLQKAENPIANENINKIHSIIQDALNVAEEWGMIYKNVAKVVKPPSFTRNNMKIWNEKEVIKFLEVAKKDRYFMAFFLAISTGMRRGEILGLRWGDIEKEQVFINQTLSNRGDCFQEPKSQAGRRLIALPDETSQALKQHKKEVAQDKLLAGPLYKDHDLVISTSIGTPLNPSNLLRTFRKLIKQADVPSIRFHDLRHTHATLMLKQGVHPKIVSERLGHANIRITLDTYSHVLPGLQESAAKEFGQTIFKDMFNENKSS